MSKRNPTSELNHENWDDEDEKEDAGHFKSASEDVLKKREIRVAKRRTLGNEDKGTGGLFKSFTGFTSNTGGSFCAGGGGGNGAGSGASPAGSFNFSSAASSTAVAAVPAPAVLADSNAAHLAQLKSLNESVLRWIQSHLTASPFCVLTPVFTDYERHLADIERRHPYVEMPENGAATAATAAASAAATASSAQAPPFNFLASTAAMPSVTNPTPPPPAATAAIAPTAAATKTTATTPMPPTFNFNFSTAASSQSALSSASASTTAASSLTTTAAAKTGTTVPVASTTKPTAAAFVFGGASSTSASAAAPAPAAAPAAAKTTAAFFFGSSSAGTAAAGTSGTAAAPATAAMPAFSFGPTPAAPATSLFSPGSFLTASTGPSAASAEDQEEEEYEPPKPESREIREEGEVFSRRCKLFYMSPDTKEWREKGVGCAHLKPAEAGRAQLIVRADNTLGTILLNTLVTKEMTLSVTKNNLSLACLPNPPLPTKAKGEQERRLVPFLVRFKAESEAKELLSKIEELRA